MKHPDDPPPDASFLASGRLPVRVFDTVEELGEALAAELIALIDDAGRRRRRFLLGCPGGRSPQPVYRALARHARDANPNWSHLVIVMMDDYVVADSHGFVHVPDDAHYSCRRFGRDEIVAPINEALSPSHRIPRAHLWVPDPADPAGYDSAISKAGGVDVFLVASGTSDGHVAFCPPGSDPDGKTTIVELAATTRLDNLSTFPAFGSLAEVPTHGVSVGLGTISALSHDVRCVAHGDQKRHAVQQLISAEGFTPEWPATILWRSPSPSLWVTADTIT